MRIHFVSVNPRLTMRIILSIVVFVTLLGTFAGNNVLGVSASQAASSGDWPTYLFNNARLGFNASETIINPNSAPNLKLKWVIKLKGCPNSPGKPHTISTQTVVSQSLQLIFWGSWDGCQHATDFNGNEVWATYIGRTTNHKCGLPTIGVASTATIITENIGGKSTPVLLVGGGNAYFYALNALTGVVIWKTQLGSAKGSFIWSSPAVYNGSVYEGLSSQLDCPLVQGKFFRMNASTGAIQNTFDVVPMGCSGGSVWGSPTIDEAAGTLYFGTGNGGSCSKPEPYAVALIELKVSNLALIGFWQVPPSKQVPDSDFGTTPTLFQATIHGVMQHLVGLENKNGIYYAFVRGKLSNGPIWQATIANGEITSSSSWDGTHLYVAGGYAKINGTPCDGTDGKGSLRALDPATGAFLWQDCFPVGDIPAAVTTVPGVAVVGVWNVLEVVATATGKVLFTYKDTRGRVVRFFGPASIANGVLYIGDSIGNLMAFAP